MRPLYEPSHYRDHNDFGLFVTGVLLTLLLIAVILGIAALLRKNSAQSNTESADLVSVVKTRYANGEITKQEYDQLLADLAPVEPVKSSRKKKQEEIAENN